MTLSPESPSVSPSPTLSWLDAAIRFTLEMAMLAALGYWGWSLSETIIVQVIAAIGIPTIAAALWVIFRTPGDTSAGKPAIIPIPGKLRLL